jgi:hypothetical protein
MALRHRQEGGIPLTPSQGMLYTSIGVLILPLLARNIWFPLFESVAFQLPQEVKMILMWVSMIAYLVQSAWRVPPGKEQAQLFMGRYTGVSFPAGICFLPALPFPLFSLVLKYAFSHDINVHFGWTLEGGVSLESLVVKTRAEGLTPDGIRVALETTLIFEIVHVATFLSQTRQDTDRIGLIQAVSSQVSSSIKQTLIAYNTAEQLYRASYTERGEELNQYISKLCNFENEFGVVLAQSPVTVVQILNERIREAFDTNQAKDLLRRNTNEYALAFAEFKKTMPPGVSDDVALAFFNTARMNTGQSPVTMNMVKFN